MKPVHDHYRDEFLKLQKPMFRMIVLAIALLGSEAIVSQGYTQTLQRNDHKYNSGSAAANHMTLGLDLLKAGAPEDLFYARQNFVFVINMADDRGFKPEAYMNLGVVDTLEGNTDAAMRNFFEAIKLRPDYAEAYFNLGGAYYKQKLLNQAEDAFRKAIDLQPEYGRAHYSLGFVYLDQKKYELARRHAEKAAEYGVPFRTLRERLAKTGQ